VWALVNEDDAAVASPRSIVGFLRVAAVNHQGRSNMPNENRTVIVTGGGGAGCGRSISARFATRGAAIVVSDIDEAGGRETVRLIERGGGRAAFFRADVRNDAQTRNLVAFAEDTFGAVNVLINNASAPHGGEGIDSWMDPLETDLLGAI
jgi:NAD(P)-dependent dehydrogenase (short-subunit alcohol dehydrogenase family)